MKATAVTGAAPAARGRHVRYQNQRHPCGPPAVATTMTFAGQKRAPLCPTARRPELLPDIFVGPPDVSYIVVLSRPYAMSRSPVRML
jgi:hypothetical protein